MPAPAEAHILTERRIRQQLSFYFAHETGVKPTLEEAAKLWDAFFSSGDFDADLKDAVEQVVSETEATNPWSAY